MFVDYEKKGKVAILTLNRPERLNAYGPEIFEGLSVASQKVQDDPEVRVAILTGKGRAFCAGRDVHSFAESIKAGGTMSPGLLAIGRALSKVETKPVIAAVNGYCLGGALGMLQTCEIIIAAKSAQFGYPEIKLGIPYVGPGMLMSQGISLSAATELVLLGDLITAQRAYEIGMINKVVPDSKLMDEAMKIAEKIIALPPLAVAGVKQSKRRTIEEYRKIFSPPRLTEQEDISKSAEHKEAVTAFLEKRRPVFESR